MGRREEFASSIDEIIGDLGALNTSATQHAPSPEITAAIACAQKTFVAVDRFISGLHEEDLADIESCGDIWQAIAVAQDQVQRAQAAVAGAWTLCNETAELKRTAHDPSEEAQPKLMECRDKRARQ